MVFIIVQRGLNDTENKLHFIHAAIFNLSSYIFPAIFFHQLAAGHTESFGFSFEETLKLSIDFLQQQKKREIFLKKYTIVGENGSFVGIKRFTYICKEELSIL